MAKIIFLAVACAYFAFTARAQSGGSTAWLSGANRLNLELVAGYIAKAPYLGLRESDYQPGLIRSLVDNTLSMPTAADTAAAEELVNRIAIRFFSDIAYGRLQQPPVKYNGPPYDPVYSNIGDSMAVYLAEGRFSSFLASIEPATCEYLVVKERIAFFRSRMADSSFRDVVVTGLRADTSNKPLLARLAQFGFLDALAADSITNREVREKLGTAQRMFNLLPDGMLRSSVYTCMILHGKAFLC